MRNEVLELTHDARDALGFMPRVVFEGPIDSTVRPTVGAELLATLREALSNAARHAHASRVDVTVTAGEDICLRVVDDGVGPPSERSATGHGLSTWLPEPNGSAGRSSCTRVDHAAQSSNGGCRTSDGVRPSAPNAPRA